MQNFDEQNEEALWHKKLLDNKNELFVPLSAWDDMETRLDKTFGKQPHLNMEELFPLPNYAAANMDSKLDAHYAQLFDNNLSEKLNNNNISLPPNAWANMNLLLNQEFGQPSNETLDLSNEFSLPPNAWASMEHLLNQEFEYEEFESTQETLNLPNEFSLPSNAWSLMETALETEFKANDFEDYIREPHWDSNESIALPKNAWAEMENKLDNEHHEENKSRKFLAYSLLSLFLASILAGSYYYFIQNSEPTRNSDSNERPIAKLETSKHFQEGSNIEPNIHENHTTSSLKKYSNNSFSERISNPLVQNQRLYEKLSTQKSAATLSTAKYLLPLTSPNNPKGNHSLSSLKEKNLSPSNISGSNQENILEKGNSVLDIFESSDKVEENTPDVSLLMAENSNNETSLDIQDNIAENITSIQENLSTENVNIDHSIIDNSAIIEQIQTQLLLAEINTFEVENAIDSFELKKNNPFENANRWDFYAHAGIVSKIMNKNKSFSAAPSFGIGASYKIDNSLKFTVGLNIKQMYPNGGFMGWQNKPKYATLDEKQQAILEEYDSLFPTLPNGENNPNLRPHKTDIYQLKSVTILEMPISIQKQIGRKHILEVGIKVGMNLFANMRREKNVDVDNKPLSINRYDIGLSLLNFGAFASYEYKINEHFSFVAQYSKSLSNMLRSAENRTKIYSSYGGLTPQDGNIYLSMMGMIKDNTSVLVETPERILNSDLLLALRYYF